MSILIYAKESPLELFSAYDWLTVGYRRRLGLQAITPKMLSRGLSRTAPNRSAVELGSLLHAAMLQTGQPYGKLEWSQARVRAALHGRDLLTMPEIRALASSLGRPAWRLYGGSDPGPVEALMVYTVKITMPSLDEPTLVRATGVSPEGAVHSAKAWSVSSESGLVGSNTDPSSVLDWTYEVQGISKPLRPGMVTPLGR